jgi:hypothetical protein
MATLLKVLNNLADIKSAGGVALGLGTQDLFDDPVRWAELKSVAWAERVERLSIGNRTTSPAFRRISDVHGTDLEGLFRVEGRQRSSQEGGGKRA